jgi:3D (Asp-Asp-Asp) domain-containing protein
MVLCLLAFISCFAARSTPHPGKIEMRATAYSLSGRTACGGKPHRGIAAADPGVLPLGSQVEIKNAGPYSGIYEVCDTGRTVRGRLIDIYIPSASAAQKFGVRGVEVRIVKPPPRQQ